MTDVCKKLCRVPNGVFVLVIFLTAFTVQNSTLQYALIISLAVIGAWLLNSKLTQSKRYTREIGRLTQLAYHDGLTGLYNRRKIVELLDVAVASQMSGWVLIIDLDNFKAVNDQYGHHAGDQLLRHTANKLRETLGDEAHIGRIGGDEFVIVTDCCSEPLTLMADIKSSIGESAGVDSSGVSISASIGAARLDTAATSVSELLHQADQEMYLDKARTKKLLLEVDDMLVSRTSYVYPVQLAG